MGSGSSVQRTSRGDHGSSKAPGGQNNLGGAQQAIPQLDKQLPFANYREWYNLKNFWKTVQRNKDTCAKLMFFKYLEENADLRQAYGKLRAVEMSEEIAFNNSDFEHLANQYLDVFDEAITAIESNPGDVSSVVEELQAVGKRHKRINGVEESSFAKLQEGFVQMARHVLQDRFTENVLPKASTPLDYYNYHYYYYYCYLIFLSKEKCNLLCGGPSLGQRTACGQRAFFEEAPNPTALLLM
uniref:GLOBIN domain-containing protein n=1 Tax=Trichuris muris TaxID=70415 RepID=A0A5S6QXB5_TRIMR